MAADDTEITLGAGKLLGLFFILVAICGVFFAIGYSLGKTSAREQALNDRAATDAGQVASTSEPQASKPSAALKTAQTEPAPTVTEADAAKSGPDLTFYKAVKQNGPEPETQTPAKTPTLTKSPSTAVTKAASEQTVATPSSQDAQVTNARVPTPSEAKATEAQAPVRPDSTPTAASSAGTFLVQVAAVSHEEDAAALAGALRKKSYGASVVNNPAGKDKLYHVVIGPFATLQDAEATKAKLQGDGYNPIVKR